LSCVRSSRYITQMNETGRAGILYDELFARASRAATVEECEECLAEIERLLGSATDPADRGRLLMCRARVRSNQWRTAAVYEDARAAMRLFERAGEGELVVDAASWAAAHASRMGELSVASDLATRSLLAVESVEDDRLRVEIFNRLGIFCISFLDYDRALEQLDASLAAAERLGDVEKISRQLANIADCLLLIHRQRHITHAQDDGTELLRANSAIEELFDRATDDFIRRTGTYRLRAEVLCELGRPQEALAVLDQYRDQSSGLAIAAQRAAIAWIEARCLRLTGQADRALTEAHRAVSIAQDSDDDQAWMEALEELAAAQEAAGDSDGALATAREVNARIWTIHQRETRQLVEEVWGRADFVRDQATLQSQAAEATRRADEDALTGIGNRRILERFVADEAQEQFNLALIVVDIDDFKQINDSFGHPVGDAVLRRIGHLLKGEMRAHQVAVRYGGDEFVLGLLGVDLEVAAGFAERLRRRTEQQDWNALAPGLRVTASLGVASGARRGWRAIFSAADAAMYTAKREGKNTVATAPRPLEAL
jgi:diguanylate cyclase (GGDEF)-like protein